MSGINMGSSLRFGPAGMPSTCKGKRLAVGIDYTASLGLHAFEVEFVRGVRIRKEHAIEACRVAKQKDVLLSCHGPYWVNCCSPFKEKQAITIRNIMDTLRAAQLLGAYTVVFHPGYYQKLTKEQAFNNALQLLKRVIERKKREKLSAFIGLETVGKRSAFGDLDENIELCKRLGLKHVRPVIDFAHIHARGIGAIKKKENYEEILNKIKKELGSGVLQQLHCHFTEIEFSEKGERHHLAVGTKDSPPFKPLAQLISKRNYSFTVISESPLLEKDALKMQKICSSF